MRSKNQLLMFSRLWDLLYTHKCAYCVVFLKCLSFISMYFSIFIHTNDSDLWFPWRSDPLNVRGDSTRFLVHRTTITSHVPIQGVSSEQVVAITFMKIVLGKRAVTSEIHGYYFILIKAIYIINFNHPHLTITTHF